jgi:pimeloyl-ACP methyl ester carboxylesterase
MKKLKLTSFILLLLFIVLALSGSIYETISYKNVKDNYPPEGFMVNVGDREIHVNIKGEKSDIPAVVIETGTGTWSYDWFNFQEELSKYTQVITYDRAGYGWSDPPVNGFSLETTISDLNMVLEQAEVETPIILIGHSVGGVYARHFNDQ